MHFIPRGEKENKRSHVGVQEEVHLHRGQRCLLNGAITAKRRNESNIFCISKAPLHRMRLQHRNVPDFPDSFPSVPDDLGCLGFRVFYKSAKSGATKSPQSSMIFPILLSISM